jgi:2-methylcitrate dehydratase PrpD
MGWQADPAAPSATLARFVAEATVPADVRRTARRYLLDWLGSALAGGELEPPRMVQAVAEELGGASQATVLASGARSSAPLAALVNAAASHVLEMDDLDRASISHPGAPVIAAALAVGERDGASGEELLDAIAIGYEAMIRIGEALGPAHYEHWHMTGTAGTFGAAAAASRLARLDAPTTLMALGSAGTMTAGLWEFLADGAMSKQLHPAKAAHDGVLAALLAARGFTAATRILEGPKGLFAAMAPDSDAGAIVAGLDPRMSAWRIGGVSFKVHASCRHTHPAVDAALALREQHGLRPDEVERVAVRIYTQALGLLEGMEPTTPYAAKFSLPYCVAAALAHGDLAPQRFSEPAIAEAEVLALAGRISFAPDPELDALYPAAWPSVVTVTTRDGRTIEQRVEHPAGDPENGLTDEDVAAKFATIAGPLLNGRAHEIAREVLASEPAPDARQIARAVTLVPQPT